jgi:S1-C subfamily serine protease
MTFDFANRSLYLKQGHRFDWPDKLNLSGLHILRTKGDIRVDAVDEGSPAAAAGVLSGDVLLMVNGEKANDTALMVLRERFCWVGQQFRLVVRRGTQQREISFVLPKTE